MQLDAILPRCADPGMALVNLERFMAAVPRIDSTLDELANNVRTTEILLFVFSTSQYLSEVLIRDPELLGWLQGGPERPDRSALIDELWTKLDGLSSDEEQRTGACDVSASGRACASVTTTSCAAFRWN